MRRVGAGFLAFFALWLTVLATTPSAHDIPNDVLVQMFFKPEG